MNQTDLVSHAVDKPIACPSVASISTDLIGVLSLSFSSQSGWPCKCPLPECFSLLDDVEGTGSCLPENFVPLGTSPVGLFIIVFELLSCKSSCPQWVLINFLLD